MTKSHGLAMPRKILRNKSENPAIVGNWAKGLRSPVVQKNVLAKKGYALTPRLWLACQSMQGKFQKKKGHPITVRAFQTQEGKKGIGVFHSMQYRMAAKNKRKKN